MFERVPTFLVLLTSSLGFAACGGGGGGNGAPPPPPVTVSATLSTVVANPDTAPADGTTAAVVTVVLRDDNGDPLAGRSVETRVSDPSVSIVAQPADTDAAGSTSVEITSTQPIEADVSVAVDPGSAAESVLATSVTVRFLGEAPVPTGAARFEDRNRDSVAGLGDRVVVPFTLPVMVDGATAQDFVLPVDQDTLGVGATIVGGPADNEVSILLGDSPRLRARGQFAINATDDGMPSGIGLASGITSITAAFGGQPAASGNGVLDLIPGFASAESLTSVTGEATAILAGDLRLDRDGASDLAVGSSLGVDVFVGDGAGFASAVFLPTANPVRAVAAADFDRDGRVDLAVIGGSAIQSFRNITLGTANVMFAPPGTTAVPGEARDLTLGDIDCDGDVDLVVATAAGVVSIRQESVGVTSTSITAEEARAVALADLDRDGDLDLLVGRANATAQSFENDGSGTFSGPTAVDVLDATTIAVADLDGDGRDDWIMAQAAASMRIGRSTAGFVPVDLPGSSAASRVRITDLDGDGRSDVLALGATGIDVLVQQTNGEFVLATDSIPADVDEFALADVDRDGDADVVTATGSQLDLRAGSATAVRGLELSTNADLILGGEARAVAAGDFDGDGIVDLAVVHAGPDPANVLLKGDGVGNFTQLAQTFGDDLSSDVAAVDFDCDGDLDLIVANSPGDFGPATQGLDNELWLNDGSGQFARAAAFDASASTSIAIGDLDGDDLPDIVVGNRGQAADGSIRRNRVFLNRGFLLERANAFGPSDNPDNLHDTRDVTLGDIDGDGDLDLVVANNSGPDQLWRNGGDAVFSLVRQLGASAPTFSVALADLDRNGDLDLVTGVQVTGGSRSQLWLGSAGIDFLLPLDLPNQSPQTLPTGIVVEDIDLDGHPDILIANGNAAQADRIYFGDEALTFGQFIDLEPSSSRGIVVVDADRDGGGDVVVAERNGIGTRIYRNR